MPSLKMLSSGLLTTLQDLGNPGLAFYAIPAGGAMDRTSARRANLILGNKPNAQLLECSLLPPRIEFLADTRIALTGADAYWTLNGEPLSLYSTIEVKKGDHLSGQMIQQGMRAYLALQAEEGPLRIENGKGMLKLKALAPLTERTLRKGDILHWDDRPEGLFFTEMKLSSTISAKDELEITFYPGPEFSSLTKSSKQQLFSEKFSFSSESNRIGLLLDGPKLQCKPARLKQSVPVFPGCIQLPPSGQPILLMRDAQVTGGYPRIGYVSEQELDVLAQVRPRHQHFKLVRESHSPSFIRNNNTGL